MLEEFGCKDKVAIVTGGGRGIGKAIALALAEAGADIVVAGRTLEPLNETAKEVKSLGRRCIPVVTDVTVAKQVENMVSRAINEMGKVDILVSNAGLVRVKPIVPLPGAKYTSKETLPEEFFGITTDEQWADHINTNLTGPFYCARAVAPHMLERKQGKIIIVSSIGAIIGRAYETPYCASKAGTLGLIRSLAREWGKYNVYVNGIAPGAIATEMSKRILEDKTLLERRLQRVPLKKIGQPRDIALTAVFLASAASNHITGTFVIVDGGETA